MVDRSVQCKVVDADGVNRFWCQSHVEEEQRHYRKACAQGASAGTKRKGAPGSTDGAGDPEDGSQKKKKKGRKKGVETELWREWDTFRSQIKLGTKEGEIPSPETISARYWALSEQEWDTLVAETQQHNREVQAGVIPGAREGGYTALRRNRQRKAGPGA